MTTLSTRLGSGLLLAGLLAAPLGLQAQGKSQKMTVDDIALKNYSLSMSNMRKLRDAMVEMQAYAKAHPDEADKWDTGDDDSKTLNEKIAQIGAIPPARAVLAKVGLTPRDYIMTSLTYLQAAMLVGMHDAYAKGKPIQVPYNMNPANVAFIQQHAAELKALGLDKAAGGDDDTDQ